MMQVHHKPQLDQSAAQTLLQEQWPQAITSFEALVEGEDSQAFRFEADGRRYVLRLNRSDIGFRKDAYATEHFLSARVPIPEIFNIGRLDDDHAYCVSEFVSGKTIQDLDRQAVEALLPQTLSTLQAIADTDISHSPGYGELDETTGRGLSASWQEWLLAHISRPGFAWDEVVAQGDIDQSFLDNVFNTFTRLVDKTPNERRLVHGDFSSNNVLADSDKIVAVLDWDAACYGDWLFDVAGAYYWRDHLMCMAVQSSYYEQQLASLPNYRARIDCYQLRASLVEMYVQARRKEQSKLEWHIKRCQALLGKVSS